MNVNEMSVQDCLSLLGKRVKEAVTGMEGIVTNVGFDLYGCIQAIVHPGIVGKDGKISETHWFDINRLTVIKDKPVMQQPSFVAATKVREKGAEVKPTPNHWE